MLAGCADGDPNNVGRYYSCSDWLRAHGAAPARRDLPRADPRVLEDWLLEAALDRDYEITEAPVSGNNGISEKALIERLTAQCAKESLTATLDGAIEVMLNHLDLERHR